MTDITANIRLRPTRIGFLVRPNDMVSVRNIMKICSGLWGGLYNPIIPVFRTFPKEWKRDAFGNEKATKIIRGYIEFFEPDVFVEAESGLAEKAGLTDLIDKSSYKEYIVPLNKFLQKMHNRDWAEPYFGLNMLDMLQHHYNTVQRFQLKHKRTAVVVKPEPGNGVVEALFGAYPTQKDMDYLLTNYKDVFEPQVFKSGPALWKKVFLQEAYTPLNITEYKLETRGFGRRDLIIFVFNPEKSTDLIDLWNLRAETEQFLAVPVAWIKSLSQDISKIITDEYRPVRGNPNGVMHNTILEFARSIEGPVMDELVNLIKEDLPQGSFIVKPWRDRIWTNWREPGMASPTRLEVISSEKRSSMSVKKEYGKQYTEFESISPEFATLYGGHKYRWVNILTMALYRSENIATVFPFNIFERQWPSLSVVNERVIIGTEGWVFAQEHKDWNVPLCLPTREEGIIGTLKSMGIEANLSEPGHIAKQILEHLGDIWGISLLADVDTLKLLNNMAGAVRRKSNHDDTLEENFERRSAPVQKWKSLIKDRQKHSFYRVGLDDFTKKNILKLGMETNCPNCQYTNWHSLTLADYKLTCERCLYIYDFPQAALLESERKWAYRVVGPFSVPDYARGSYGALLAIRELKNLTGHSVEMTFSTAMTFKFDGVVAEADFIALRQNNIWGPHKSPEMIIGEAKSFGASDLLKQKDIIKLKAIGQKLPGSYLMVSVLRNYFTINEKKLLRSLVNWGRRPDDQGYPTNPVILLTGHELFSNAGIAQVWKKLGEPYSSFTDFHITSNLSALAEATQIIHLGLPSLHQVMESKWKKRREKTEKIKKNRNNQ